MGTDADNLNARYAHCVQFFDEDARLVEAVSHFVRESIESACTCLSISTAEHRTAIDSTLQSAGVDVASLIGQYRYVPLDAHALLSTFLVDGRLDRERFHSNMDQLMRQVTARGEPVRIFGEMVALLLATEQPHAALQLEELWNELSRQHDFQLLCAYPSREVEHDDRLRMLICAVHSSVLGEPH